MAAVDQVKLWFGWDTLRLAASELDITDLEDEQTEHCAVIQQQPTRMRFYDLRHTCASLLLAQGVHADVGSKAGAVPIQQCFWNHLSHSGGEGQQDVCTPELLK
jgi:hypothetical protein